MQTRGALRSSPLPERAAGPELVLARGRAVVAAAAAGESERDGVGDAAVGPTRERASKGGEARASPPGSPPCGRLSAGGYRGGTVPCWRAREGRAPGTGEAPVLLAPTCSVVVPRGGGVSRRRRESLSLPAEAVACRPAGRSPRQGRLCRAPLSVLVPGMGVSVSVASRSLFSLPTLARGREGPGERREDGRAAEARNPCPSGRPAGGRSFGLATSDQTWRPAEFKHISQRRKRN